MIPAGNSLSGFRSFDLVNQIGKQEGQHKNQTKQNADQVPRNSSHVELLIESWETEVFCIGYKTSFFFVVDQKSTKVNAKPLFPSDF